MFATLSRAGLFTIFARGPLAAALCAILPLAAGSASTLEEAWQSPPHEARLGAYWWWLNGNVTKEAITGDLEAMQKMGFGHAVIFDANGASQNGNDPVPAGPTFGSPPWRELYKHALREAKRCGLTLSLNIQSGWNLGGPTVTADDAGKIAVWSQTSVQGPRKFNAKLPLPATKTGYFRDSRVVAWRRMPTASHVISASSSQRGSDADAAGDGADDTFWVSKGSKEGDGPSPANSQWIQYEFAKPIMVNAVKLTPRPRFGPSAGQVQISKDGKKFFKAADFTNRVDGETTIPFSATTAKVVRLLIEGAHDPGSGGGKSRNVQIAGFSVWNDGKPLTTGLAPIGRLSHKILQAKIRGSAPDLSYLLTEEESGADAGSVNDGEVIDLTSDLSADGLLRWDVPEGEWQILRFGCTIGPRSKVSTSSADWKGHALDVLDEGAFTRYWDAVVTPLLDDAEPFAGSTLKYLHTDSWEVEPINWTPTFPEEFKKRRGYGIEGWLPVFAGQIVGSREASNRFLSDFRRTLGDLAVDNHYKPFLEKAHARGFQIHPESGGPHVVPIDAQQCLGLSDVPMSEFWAASWRHRVTDAERFFVKQPASAAHTNGRRLVMAEGFTTIGPHWQERIWNNLKPSFDKACTEGLNALVWHAWVCSPDSTGIPGQQYFAGTHLNPKVTWWSRGKPFFDYINRSQAMLQRGIPVADVLYYYGNQVPNYTQRRDHDPAGVGKGYDYDVISEDVLLSRVSVKDGRLVLPEGTSYALLMLPDLDAISLPVLRKVRESVTEGALVAGPQPRIASESGNAVTHDAEVERLGGELWSATATNRVANLVTARAALEAMGLTEDFSFTGGDDMTDISYIHRRDGDDEIYFIASRGERPETIRARFRVTGKIPELWNPVSGKRSAATGFEEKTGGIEMPLAFDPCGSVFVVFRDQATALAGGSPEEEPRTAIELDGPWEVQFDPRWGGPRAATFAKLVSWTERPEPGIKYFSGTATYRKRFDLPAAISISDASFLLDLGDLAELAEVRLNGQALGITWTPPFRVDVTGALKPGGNHLEIDIVNFWPNRIIGDASLPDRERLTKTNIRQFTAKTSLMKSGLFGPVRLLAK